MYELLEVMRVQRHDFMNHLQVISGLLQLKKNDRAADYIKQVAQEMSQEGALARIGIPGIVAVVLTAELDAKKQGIRLSKNIGTGLDEGLRHEKSIIEIIREMLDMAVRFTEAAPNRGEEIGFEIMKKNGAYMFSVGFKSREENPVIASGIALIKQAADKIDAGMVSESSPEGLTVITFSVPVE